MSVIAYCLMLNHYHLIVRTGAVPMSRYMHRLLTAYSVYHNHRWDTVGHPFQGRFQNRICRDDNDLRGLIRYVHMNSVNADLVETVDDWRWSSHRACVGLPGSSGATALISALFDDDLTAYRRFLQEPLAERPSLAALARDLRFSVSNSRVPSAIQAKREFSQAAVGLGYRRSEIARFLGQTRGALSRLLRRGESCITEA